MNFQWQWLVLVGFWFFVLSHIGLPLNTALGFTAGVVLFFVALAGLGSDV